MGQLVASADAVDWMNAAQRSIAIREQQTLAELREMLPDMEPLLLKPEAAPQAQVLLCRVYGKLRKLKSSDFTVVIPDKSKPADFEIVPSPGGVVL